MSKDKVILRIKKHKTAGNIKAVLLHNYRCDVVNESGELKYARHADIKKSDVVPNGNHKTGNWYKVGSDKKYRRHQEHSWETLVDDANKIYTSRIKELLKRSDSVHVLEYVISASPGFFTEKTDVKKQVDYLADSIDWVKNQHGEKNFIGAAIHWDETSPHVHVLVMPVVEQKRGNRHNDKVVIKEGLSARPWTGNSAILSQGQTDIYEKVGKRYGLERGQMKSKARHKTLKTFYAERETEEKKQLAFNKEILKLAFDGSQSALEKLKILTAENIRRSNPDLEIVEKTRAGKKVRFQNER